MNEKQMKERCPESKLIGKGFLPNYRIGFTRYSKNRQSAVADILIKENGEVWGLLYEISGTDLESLDRSEGIGIAYRRIEEKVNIYRERSKEEVVALLETEDIEAEDNNRFNNLENYVALNAFVYEVIKKDLSNEDRVSLAYLNPILDAAYENSFPLSYQSELNSFSKKDINFRKSQQRDLFYNLCETIESEDFSKKVQTEKEWGGAGLVVTGSEKRKEQLLSGRKSDTTIVLTPHWKELSWIVRTIFHSNEIKWEINHLNKYYYLGEMGKAAIEYQESVSGIDSSHIGICEAVILKVYEVFK